PRPARRQGPANVSASVHGRGSKLRPPRPSCRQDDTDQFAEAQRIAREWKLGEGGCRISRIDLRLPRSAHVQAARGNQESPDLRGGLMRNVFLTSAVA